MVRFAKNLDQRLTGKERGRSILRDGRPGDPYNVGGGTQLSNLELVSRVCDIVDALAQEAGPPRRSLITFVKDRPGHDRHYAVDSSAIRGALGWVPEVSFDDGLRETVRWYLEHSDWCWRVTEGRYDGRRLGD